MTDDSMQSILRMCESDSEGIVATVILEEDTLPRILCEPYARSVTSDEEGTQKECVCDGRVAQYYEGYWAALCAHVADARIDSSRTGGLEFNGLRTCHRSGNHW